VIVDVLYASAVMPRAAAAGRRDERSPLPALA